MRGLSAIVAVLGVAALWACRERPAVLEAPPVPHAQALGAVTVHYMGEARPRGRELDAALAARFERDTGAHVEVVPMPVSSDEAFVGYMRLLRPGGPVDVAMLDIAWTGALAPRLRDLRPELGREAAAHWPVLVKTDTVDGRLVALPLYLEGGVLFYRKDLLARYGFAAPPITWEALETMAAAIQNGERQRHPQFQGFVWQGRAYEGLTCNALEWQVSAGAPVVDPATGMFAVRDPRSVAAFRRAARWIGTISPPWVTELMEDDSLMVFQEGNAAFMRHWTSAAMPLGLPGSPVAGDFGVAALPHLPTAVLGGWQVGVSAHAANPAASVAFARYMSSPEVQAWRAEQGAFLPSRPALYEHLPGALQPFKPALLAFIARPSEAWGVRYALMSRIYARGVSQILQGEEAGPVANWMAIDMARTLGPPRPTRAHDGRLTPPWGP